jgi:ABC-type glycerol-3-phosphate transport system substrate-binding protein
MLSGRTTRVRTQRVIAAVTVALVLAAAGLMAQAPARSESPADALARISTVPELSETEKLRLVATAQQVEIADLKVKQAQNEFELSRARLQALVSSLQVEGFVFDMRSMTYQPKATEATTP